MANLLAEKLQLLRLERGLTIRQAAAATGVAKETISDLERGRRTPVPPTLYKIARGYGVPPRALLERTSFEEVSEYVQAGEAPTEEAARPFEEASGGPQRQDLGHSEDLRENLIGFRKMLDSMHAQILEEAKAYADAGDVEALSTLVVRVGFEARAVERFTEEEGVAELYETNNDARRVYASVVRLHDLVAEIDETFERLRAQEGRERLSSVDDNVIDILRFGQRRAG